MLLSVTQVVNVLLCSDELYCLLNQSGVAVAGATYAAKMRWREAVTVSLFFHPLTPTTTSAQYRAFCTLPSFACIKTPTWQSVELNDRHLPSYGKIGDCEQSTIIVKCLSWKVSIWTKLNLQDRPMAWYVTCTLWTWRKKIQINMGRD